MHTHGLLEKEKIKQFEERVEVKTQQRDQEICLKNVKYQIACFFLS